MVFKTKLSLKEEGHISTLYIPGCQVGNIYDNKGMTFAGVTGGILV